MAIQKDFENPKCRDYQIAPLGTLPKPAFGGACYHIHLSRDSTTPVPYTLEAYLADRDAWWQKIYLSVLALGVFVTVAISATVYFLGWLTGWVLKGFGQH